MADYASEKSHWYDSEGKAQHTYINSKGVVSNTTLREARKFKYKPSSTKVIGLAARPSLDNWKQEQTILACLTLPKIEGESEDDYIKRIKEDARSHAEQAAQRGTEIHGYIERGFVGDISPEDANYKFYLSVYNLLVKECGEQEWNTERTFASSLGFGGCVDLHNDEYLIDFKTTDKSLATVKTWDEHAMQLASYDCGLENTGRKCGICYVHRDTAESKLLWLKEEDLLKGQRCFLSLLEYYYCKTGLER